MTHTEISLRSLFGDDGDDDDDDEESLSQLCDEDKDTSDDLAPATPSGARAIAMATEETDEYDSEGGGVHKRRRTSSMPPIFANTTTIEANHKNNKNNSNGSNDYDSWRQKIGIFDGVLTPDECDELIAVHASEAHGGYIDHMEVTRVSDLTRTAALPLVLPLLRARYKMWETVEEFFPDAGPQVFPEYTALASWHAGAFLRTHYDSNKDYLKDRHYSALLYLNDPGHDPSRDGDDEEASSMVANQSAGDHHHPSNYHRNGFSGGDLFFVVPSFSPGTNNTRDTQQPPPTTPPRRIAVQPRAGRLVCFPSSHEFLHGVEEITRGVRFALTMWFTKHDDAMESLESLQHEYYRSVSSVCTMKVPGKSTTRSVKRDLTSSAAQAAPVRGFSRFPHPEQPWETPAGAVALRLRVLHTAGIPKPPANSLLPRGTTVSKTVTDAELRHLIAYCWWKKGCPLGDLLESAVAQTPPPMNATAAVVPEANPLPRNGDEQSTVWIMEGGSEFLDLVRGWSDNYLPRRSRGLASALDRWMNRESTLITSVLDDEME